MRKITRINDQHKENVLANVNKLLDIGGKTIFLYFVGTKCDEVKDFRIFRGEFPLPVVFGMVNSIATYMMLAQVHEYNNTVRSKDINKISPFQDTISVEYVTDFHTGLTKQEKYQYPQNEKNAIFQQFNIMFDWGCDTIVLYAVTYDGLHVNELKGYYGHLLPHIKIGIVKAVANFLQELRIDYIEDGLCDKEIECNNYQNITFH
jgi:hypothetical protein